MNKRLQKSMEEVAKEERKGVNKGKERKKGGLKEKRVKQ